MLNSLHVPIRLGSNLEQPPDADARLDAELALHLAVQRHNAKMVITEAELQEFSVRKVFEGAGVSHPHGEAIEEVSVFQAQAEDENKQSHLLRIVCRRGLLPLEPRTLNPVRYQGQILSVKR